MAKKKVAKRAPRKKTTNLTSLLYDKKNWQMWLIVYGGIAIILYGTLYFFIFQKYF